MSEEDDFVRITLRIPKALHEALTEAAAKKRSMNAEIIDRLEETFPDPKARERVEIERYQQRLLMEKDETVRMLEDMKDRLEAIETQLKSL